MELYLCNKGREIIVRKVNKEINIINNSTLTNFLMHVENCKTCGAYYKEFTKSLTPVQKVIISQLKGTKQNGKT
jgi:hypothetical protein